MGFAEAAASVAAQQVGAQVAATSGPVRNAMPIDPSNPFASPSQFKGGVFTPSPPMDVLIGRTLVYIPRSYDPAAKVPTSFGAAPGATRKQWTTDLYVIDGGEMRFWYEQKGDPNAVPPVPTATVEQVVENVSPATPYVCLGQWVAQAAFIGKLTGAADTGKMLIGTPVRGAMKAQIDKGATDASVQAEYAAWIARGKQGAEPRFVWLLADVSAEQVASVQAWWAAHKDSIKL
jgi:hypothetical protein